MITFVQLLLAVVITTLTFLVAFAAIQVFHILHEFRQVLKRINRILDTTSNISDVAHLKSLMTKTDEELAHIATQAETFPKSSPQRYFHKSGAPLRS